MWTPKRVLILLGGFALFLSLYGVYAYFFSIYNGLPQLPEEFWPSPRTVFVPGKGGDTPPGDTQKRIIEAFGAECEELHYPVQMDLRSRGILFATQRFDIEPDGRVKLSPFSGCLFPKNREESRFPEINTVRCKVAFLTLDKKVSSVSEMGNRKIVGIELRSEDGIVIINNRGTAQKFDDIELRITNAPLFYEEAKNLIWSDGIVQLLDMQTAPSPTSIKSKGMELQLVRDHGLAKPKSASPVKKGDGVNGVEKLILRGEVDMHLYVDPQSGFLAASDNPKPAANLNKEKAHIVIQTNGPFLYDLTREQARFEIPPVNPSSTPTMPEKVVVTRESKVGDVPKLDQLFCDFLELRFRKKTVTQRGVKANHQSMDKEIETALATAEPGKVVHLNMESENLKAFGTELSYRCPEANRGPQTVIKGQPMHAFKDGHKIRAVELHLRGNDKSGQGQQAFAKGPGQIDLLDKGNEKRPYTLHAVWRDSLVSTRIVEDNKPLDLLTLTGDASFIDEERYQELAAQKLQIWLEQAPAAGTPEPVTKSQATGLGQKQRPQRLEAFHKVFAFAPDLIVRNANHLVVRFKDVPAAGTLPDSLDPTAAVNDEAAIKADPAKPAQKAPRDPRTTKPLSLEALEITAYVSRAGVKNQLHELVAEGKVHVAKESNGKDKAVDIQGEMLNLRRQARGDILNVFGDPRKPAQLEMGDIILIGPQVKIDQAENIAQVEGTGTMHMPSNTSLEGGKPAKPGSRLTVHWNKDMIFNGKFAEFTGGVQALQDESALKCQNLQVILDQEVSFKEGQKDKQNAKVEKIVCHRQVSVVEEIFDKARKPLGLRRAEFSQLTTDNKDGPTIGTGPGYVYSFGKTGGLGDTPLDTKPKPGAAKEHEFTVTRIEFEGRLFSNNKDNTRTSKFYDNVQVYHLPADKPNVPINPNQPPKGGFYMRCDLLTSYTTRGEAGKSTQKILAERKVTFQTEEFFGRADVVKFDEAMDHVIFEAAPGNTVSIIKTKGNRQEIRGTMILYKRKTGEFLLNGVKTIETSRLLPRIPMAGLRLALAVSDRNFNPRCRGATIAASRNACSDAVSFHFMSPCHSL